MTKEERIEGIKNSRENGEWKSINYSGDNKPLPVQEIPLVYLLYNPYNGRIGSLTKSHESKTGKELDPENEEDKLIIEQFLFDSAKGRNEKTLESLEIKGQEEIGIVTKDGVIIDGNRRAMLLNKLYRKDNKRDTFKAVVLKDELKANRAEITKLETNYQMGVDSKVDYNPIEKYIRCYDLNNIYGMSIEQIADLMSETKSKIQEWLSILTIMDEYLLYLGSEKVYTRLEKKEGHFVDLNSYMKSYINGSRFVNWDYNASHIQDLKTVYFDYIRLGIPVIRARVIARPTAGNSFFCQTEIWNQFFEEHEKIKSGYIEQNFTDVKENNPSKNNEDIFRDLDSKWKENLEILLEENLSENEVFLKHILESHNPPKILRRIINSLGQIKSIDKSLFEECINLISIIDKKLYDLKDKLSK